MRSIEISTDVFAKIWAHRMPGEESEDAILSRLLGANLESVDVASDENLSRPMNRILWRDDVMAALERLGGSAPLHLIYKTVREIRRVDGRRLPPSVEAIVRRELEYNSSDSESFTHRYDLFRSVEGIGSGIWAIR